MSIQQRNGRKSTTLIEGLDAEFNFPKILKCVPSLSFALVCFYARTVIPRIGLLLAGVPKLLWAGKDRNT